MSLISKKFIFFSIIISVAIVIFIGVSLYFNQEKPKESSGENLSKQAQELALMAVDKANSGDKKAALEYYQKALEIDPNHFLSLNNTANLYQDLGDWENAEKYFKRLIDAYPNHVPAYRLLGYLYWYRFGNPEEKIKTLIDQGLAATNNHPDLLSWIISYYQETGQGDKAIPYSPKLVEKLNEERNK